MLNIDATDKIEGIASVADKVEFTCSVVDGTTVKSSEGLLSNSQTQIYLAVAATRILSLTLVNTHTSAVTVNVQKDPTDAGTLYRIIPKDLSLGIGYMLISDGQRCTVMDASGNVLTSFTAHASNHQNGGSDEISVAELSGLLADDQHVLDAEVLAVAAAKGANNDITSLGALSGAQTIPTINLTGGQIAFPAAAVPSGDANTMDDWEEGTWTPGVLFENDEGNDCTYVIQAGYYTKIGRQVTLTGYVRLSGVGTSTGLAKLTSFPFTSANNSGAYTSASLTTTIITFANQIQGAVIKNNIVCYFKETTEAGVVTYLNNTNFSVDSDVMFLIVYFI